jgi:hypothetical protein
MAQAETETLTRILWGAACRRFFLRPTRDNENNSGFSNFLILQRELNMLKRSIGCRNRLSQCVGHARLFRARRRASQNRHGSSSHRTGGRIRPFPCQTDTAAVGILRSFSL